MVIKLRWEDLGAHKRVTIFSGDDKDHLAHCGVLTLRNDEAVRFRNTIRMGIQAAGFDGILEEGWVDADSSE